MRVLQRSSSQISPLHSLLLDINMFYEDKRHQSLVPVYVRAFFNVVTFGVKYLQLGLRSFNHLRLQFVFFQLFFYISSLSFNSLSCITAMYWLSSTAFFSKSPRKLTEQNEKKKRKIKAQGCITAVNLTLGLD